jgi:hypothetical protein
MRLTRVAAYLMAGVATALLLLAYMGYVYLLGFPDGFISELGRAQRRLAYIFVGISLASGACFIYLGVTPQKRIARPLAVVTALYALVIVAVLLIDGCYRSSLTGNTGG